MSDLVKLFKHQDSALNETYEYNQVAYYLDMGLGKTYVGSEKLWELNTPYNLVICQKSQISDWKEHFESFYPEYKVIVFDKQSLDIIPPESILVINYDKAWRRAELTRLRDFTLLLDESSMIKNESSNRSRFILSELHPINVILLSGTPVSGKYEEIVSQVNLLGWKISKELFLKQYTEREWDEIDGGYKIVGYKNIDRLKRKLKNYGAVFMKTDEVFDLPKQNHIKVKVKNTKLYKEFAKHHIAEYEGETIVGDTPASAKMYLRQFAGFMNKNKMQRLKELIQSTNDRLIIFYNFKKEYEMISQLCEDLERPISAVNGQGRDLEAYEKESNSVTLIQYQAGAMGLNLQKSNKAIYFTLTDRSELFEQSKKRIHRIGQGEPCFYYYLLTEGSIEWRMLNVLKEYKDYTDELFEKEDM